MMTPKQRSEIGKMWFYMAKTFRGIELDQEALTLLLNSVQELDFDKVKMFMINWLNETKTGRHPFPAEVREGCGFKKVDHKTMALEATARINQAVKRLGEFDGTEARDFIGDLGWRGVQRMGGWAHLCATHGLTLSETTFTAQMRDLLIAQLELKDAGMEDQPIMIERKNNTGALIKAGNINILELIPNKKEE